MTPIKQYIEALRNKRGYDWICNNSHLLSKYELIDIIKELDYAIKDMGMLSNPIDIYKAAAYELEDIYYEED